MLERHLIRRGFEVVVTKAPGGSETGEAYRDFFLKYHKELSPRSELATLCASMNETWHTVIEPALDAGKIVLTDRWTGSTRAYQGGGKEYDPCMVDSIIDAVLHDAYEPNLSIYTKVIYETAQDRLSGRDPRLISSLDKMGPVFFDRVIAEYDRYYPHNPRKLVGDVFTHYRIDCEGDIDENHEKIFKLVDRKITAWEVSHQLKRHQEELALQPQAAMIGN